MMGRLLKNMLPIVVLLGTASAFVYSPAALAQDGGDEGADTTVVEGAEPASPDGEEPAEGEVDPEVSERRAVGQLNRELYTVEQDVNNLKERVFRSKATLQLLKELVIEGATLGSRVSVWHISKLGASYTVESVQYFLDGKAVFSRAATDGRGLADLKQLEIHQQTLPPGMHNLQVNLVLRGNGLGVFSYLKAYSFKVQSSYTFQIEDGKITTVRVYANEKGGPLVPFVERPNVRYEEKVESLRDE